MKLGISGYGVVGWATKAAFESQGHTFVLHDLTPNDHWVDLLESDIIFICTPEAAVPEIVGTLVRDKYEGIIVIRSTVPPLTTEGLEEKYKRAILHNPEFLREAHWQEDALDPRFIIIGGNDTESLKTLTRLYGPLRAPIFTMRARDSEMFKFWSNIRLTCNISFANEMKRICDHVGANAHQINNLIAHFPLYQGHPWYVGQEYGGRCLPKDLEQLINYAHSEGIGTPLLEAIREVNDSVMTQ